MKALATILLLMLPASAAAGVRIDVGPRNEQGYHGGGGYHGEYHGEPQGHTWGQHCRRECRWSSYPVHHRECRRVCGHADEY